MVRQHTANVLRVHNILARHTGARCSVQRMHALTKQDLTRLLAEEPQGLAVTRSLVVVDGLRHQSTRLDQSVHQRLPHTPSYEQWLTVQGIGTILAPTITLATGAISRLPSVGHSASYCRWVESTKSSHGKRTGTGKVKNGPPSLAWASRAAAPCAMRFQPAAQRLSQRQLAKSRHTTVWARKAVAPKLARACYDLRRDRVPCDAPKACG